jgi:hypothetical protein
MHVKSQPQNDFLGPFGFGRVVFWLSCLLVELSFGRVVAHSHPSTLFPTPLLFFHVEWSARNVFASCAGRFKRRNLIAQQPVS